MPNGTDLKRPLKDLIWGGGYFQTRTILGDWFQIQEIIRNGMKIKTVPENARFFGEISKEYGSVGAWIGNWPSTDQIGLMDQLHKRGSRLGAMTGQYFLRFMGKGLFHSLAGRDSGSCESRGR